eukprot:2401184-Rhodomonas_salina.1
MSQGHATSSSHLFKQSRTATRRGRCRKAGEPARSDRCPGTFAAQRSRTWPRIPRACSAQTSRGPGAAACTGTRSRPALPALPAGRSAGPPGPPRPRRPARGMRGGAPGARPSRGSPTASWPPPWTHSSPRPPPWGSRAVSRGWAGPGGARPWA